MSIAPASASNFTGTATKAQAAEFFLVSLPTIDAWIRKGAPVVQRGARGVPWKLDLRAMAQWAYAPRTEDGQNDPDHLSPTDRKAWYEAENKRIDLEERMRELIPAVEVEWAIAEAFSAVVQDVRAIPDNLERRYGLPGEVAEQVEEGLFEALEVLASRLATLAPLEDLAR